MILPILCRVLKTTTSYVMASYVTEVILLVNAETENCRVFLIKNELFIIDNINTEAIEGASHPIHSSHV